MTHFNMRTLGSRLVNFVYYIFDACTEFRVRLVDPKARKPVKADYGAAGYDVFSVDDVIIEPGHRQLISTGLSLEVPVHFYVRVAPRSGLSLRGVDIGAGVIDSSYRGTVKVLVINNGTEDFVVTEGTKIAQLILERCSNVSIFEVDSLSETERGYGGFGSTGTR